jgi:hypothetical protein
MSSKSLVDPVPPHLPVGNMSAYLAGRLAFPFATTQHVAGAKVVGKTGYYLLAPPAQYQLLLVFPFFWLVLQPILHDLLSLLARRRGTTSQLLFPPLLSSLDMSSKSVVDPVPPHLPASNMSAYLAADRAAFSCTRVAGAKVGKTTYYLLAPPDLVTGPGGNMTFYR